MVRAAGLAEVTVEPVTVASTDLAESDPLLHLRDSAKAAAAAGVIGHHGAARWIAELEEAAADGHFFASLTGFLVSGRKP
jgi:hypothetical protein